MHPRMHYDDSLKRVDGISINCSFHGCFDDKTTAINAMAKTFTVSINFVVLYFVIRTQYPNKIGL